MVLIELENGKTDRTSMVSILRARVGSTSTKVDRIIIGGCPSGSWWGELANIQTTERAGAGRPGVARGGVLVCQAAGINLKRA